MLTQYEPTVNATIAFLKRINVKVNNSTVNKTLQQHPDWPSILSITDSLHKWNILNGVGKITTGKIDELPTPFLAHTSNKETPLAVVTKVTDKNIELQQTRYGHTKKVDRDSFIKSWNGVYLISEPGIHSGEAGYTANRRKEILNFAIPAGTITALIILSLLLLHTVVSAHIIPAIHIYAVYILLTAGIGITTLLLWYEIDKSNPLLQKVCTGIAKSNCNAILSGRQAKLLSWLSWSEVGFFYFTGSWLLLLGMGNTIPGITVISWLSIAAVPYTVFSVYYQWKIARQWCLLCLMVQAILLAAAVTIFLSGSTGLQADFSFSIVAKIILLYFIPFAAWYVIKPWLLQVQETKSKEREYLRMKFNPAIFDTLLQKQKPVSISTDGLGIELGNPAATNTLIKVCSPYCGPCAKAHPVIDALLEQHQNLKVKIIFTAPDNDDNPASIPVKHLMAIAEKGNNEIIKKSLDDWYLQDTKVYDVFAAKHPVNGELLTQGSKLAAMEKWCRDIQIEYTPTIFFNGHQLPDAYNIEDLKYFLLE